MPQGGATLDKSGCWPRSGDHQVQTLGDGAPSYDGLSACQGLTPITFERGNVWARYLNEAARWQLF
jgi:hypothetical protein